MYIESTFYRSIIIYMKMKLRILNTLIYKYIYWVFSIYLRNIELPCFCISVHPCAVTWTHKNEYLPQKKFKFLCPCSIDWWICFYFMFIWVEFYWHITHIYKHIRIHFVIYRNINIAAPTWRKWSGNLFNSFVYANSTFLNMQKQHRYCIMYTHKKK